MDALQWSCKDERILLDHISWQTYERLLNELGNRHLRLTYDEGDLEITTRTFGHERYNTLLGRMIATMTLELDIPIHSGGFTTLTRKWRKKGLEPDQCYWVQKEIRMRGKKEFNIEKDPSPDLAVDVDTPPSSLDRLSIFAALTVPDVWRWDGKDILINVLSAKGKYRIRKQSMTFPFLPMEEFVHFLRQSGQKNETALMRSFTLWVRSALLPTYETQKKAKPGRRNSEAG
jgi:Uma2 family endonuclease